MKKIAIDLRMLSNKNKTGIEKYASNLFQQIFKYNEEQYFVIGDINDSNFGNAGLINIDVPKSNYELSKKILALKGYLAKIDLLHSPYYPVPERRNYKGVITIHDLAPLINNEWFASRNNVEFFNIEMRKSIQNIDHIIADSQSTKNDIIRFFDFDENEISVVHLGLDNRINNAIEKSDEYDKTILKSYSIDCNYILSVCTIEPRKNIMRTLKSYELLREKHLEKIKLILVGGLGWKYNNLLQRINESKFSEDIILTGYIPDVDLPIIYRNAETFIYPSLYEGFGLPVLEAMASGAPVITSNLSSLPEVGGDAVYYCNPYDVESITFALEELLTKPSLQNELRKRGKNRAKIFTWEKAATETRKIYLDCLER